MKIKEMSDKKKLEVREFTDIYTDDLIKGFGSVLVPEKIALANTQLYKSYLQICKKTARVIKDLRLDDPVLATAAFQHILWNGYLSKQKAFMYSVPDRVLNMAIPGADVMRGKSVCLNNAEMLTRVLNEMGTEAHTVGCVLDTTQPLYSYRPQIPTNISYEQSAVFVPGEEKNEPEEHPLLDLGNHAITLVNGNKQGAGNYFYSDPTNFAYLNPSNFLEAEFVGQAPTLDVKPLLNIILENPSPEEFYSLIGATTLQSGKDILTERDVKEAFEYAIAVCRHNYDLLDDFHYDNRRDIEYVDSHLVQSVLPKNQKQLIYR